MGQPIGRLDDDRSAAGVSPGEPGAIRGIDVANVLAALRIRGHSVAAVAGRDRDICRTPAAPSLAQPGQSAECAVASSAAFSLHHRRACVMKRLLFYAYGLTSYLIFLATFLYAIAFVGGFAVANQLDGPLQTSMPAAMVVDGLLLAVFA